MSPHNLMLFGQMLAIQARVLGMQALNMQREAVGASMAYPDADFFAAERELNDLAAKVREP